MFTRPEDLTDGEVRAALELGWALEVTAIEHAPVGFGSHHWCSPRQTDAGGFATAAALREHSLDWVVPAAPYRRR